MMPVVLVGTISVVSGSVWASEAARPWRTRSQLEIAIVEWIDWYNAVRLHREIGDIPPSEFRRRLVPSPPHSHRGRHHLNRAARDPG
jgi:transposase InsO family protein